MYIHTILNNFKNLYWKNAILGIKGSGNTAATTSFRVENSTNSQSVHYFFVPT